VSQLYLIAYDIAGKRRLARLHRALRRFAMPIQYSVFLGRFTDARLAEVKAVIEGIIHPAYDDVRIYPLPADGWQSRLGRPVLADGLHCTLLPANWSGTAAPEPQPHAEPIVSSTPLVRKIVSRARTGQRKGIHIL
jgi:CRISPR-associated protein Cas2